MAQPGAHQEALRDILESHKHFRLEKHEICLKPEVVGRGGFGDIRLAEVPRLGQRTLVVKELRVIGDTDQREYLAIVLARELHVWAKLAHPHILRLLAFCFDEHTHDALLLSPYERHGNVREYLAREKPNQVIRIRLYADTSEGLAYMHGQKICHGDIKADNVLVNDDRRGVLCDFGLAKIVQSIPSGLTTMGAPKGSMRWMAPELVDAPALKHTFATDIWAWGCLGVQVLCDRIPYADTTSNVHVIMQIARCEPPSNLESLAMPEEVKLLISQCWNSQPEARPNTFYCRRDIADTLQRLSLGFTDMEEEEYESDDDLLNTPLPAEPSNLEGMASAVESHDAPDHVTLSVFDISPHSLPDSLGPESSQRRPTISSFGSWLSVPTSDPDMDASVSALDGSEYMDTVEHSEDDITSYIPSIAEQLAEITGLELSLVIDLHREALDLHSPDHPHRPLILNNLGCKLVAWHDEEGDDSCLAQAIEIHREALALRPAGHPDRAASLTNLALALHKMYEKKGDLSDLLRAIRLHRQVLDLCPLGHPARSASLTNLAVALSDRYDREGDVADLNYAIDLYREALDLCPVGHVDCPAKISHLAHALNKRFEREGNLWDLSHVIELHQLEARELYPIGDPKHCASITKLASALSVQYEREGNVWDLAHVIELHREVLESCPIDDPNRSKTLTDLAIALRDRFDRQGALSDLDLAVELHREALDLCPFGHPDRPSIVNDTADAVEKRYDHRKDPMDLSLMIQMQREALKLHPPGHPNRSVTLNRLADALVKRYREEEGDVWDLWEAANLLRETLELRPSGHPRRPTTLIALAGVLKARFDNTDELPDLTDAVDLFREAIVLGGEDMPGRPTTLLKLVDALETRYKRCKGVADLEDAFELQKEVLGLHYSTS